MFKLSRKLWMAVIALAAVAGLMAPNSLAGERLTVTIDEPFEVNGTVFAAGELRFHEIRDYSPVATLNKVSINGECVGMLLAHTVDGPLADRDELIFTRTQGGHLVLNGVALEGQPTRDFVGYNTTTQATREITATDLLASSH